jgi:hypothetical protein
LSVGSPESRMVVGKEPDLHRPLQERTSAGKVTAGNAPNRVLGVLAIIAPNALPILGEDRSERASASAGVFMLLTQSHGPAMGAIHPRCPISR